MTLTPNERDDVLEPHGSADRGTLQGIPIDDVVPTTPHGLTPEVDPFIVRGLRAVADFEYEYQMAGMNQQLNDQIETVFLMADVSLQPIASKLVKEIALFGGEVGDFVTCSVREDVVARVAKMGQLGDY